MTPFSRSTSLLVAKTSVAVVMLSFAVFAVWTTGDLLGQDPAQKKRVEEEEETPKAKPPAGKKKRVEEEEEAPRKKPKRRVIPVEEEEAPKAKAESSRPSGRAAGSDLAQLAEQATQPAVKALFRSLAVPYDLLLYKRTNVTISGERVQREEKIEPTPFYLGNDPARFRNERLRFIPFTLDWKPDKPLSPDIKTLESVTPYEEIARDKVRQFLRDSTPAESSDSARALTRYDKLVAAEQALSAVLLWHESARQTGRRSNADPHKADWDRVEAELRKQLLDEVLLEQMKELAQAQHWNRVLELTRRLAAAYSKDTDRARIFRPVADMIQSALRNPTANEQSKHEALKRLHDLEREFPDAQAFHPLADTLRAEALSLVEAANEAIRDKNMKQALGYHRRAQEIYPQLPELRTLERKLNIEHPILRVGVRGLLPKYFSPAYACTDNEHRAVEMLFESLVKLVPDEAGGYRYSLGLAESPPKVVTLGRQFELPRKTYWSDGQTSLNSTDIYTSLNLFQAGMGVGRSRVWGDLLLTAERKRDPYQVTLQLRQGFVDALAPMTFKILPRDQRQVNTEKFAMNPVTSGPYRLDGARSDEAQRPCVVFFANPNYKLRPSKKGAPHIEEIRFYTYSNPVEELRAGKLDLVLDLTAKEAQALVEKQNAGQLHVPLPSQTVPNRRIYFLAVNTHRLADKDLRQALSFAIDRETLLNKYFRSERNVSVHKALTGPFPVGSWACKQNGNNPSGKSGPGLFNRDTAKLLKEQQAVLAAAKAGPYKLSYADDGNPALGAAMKDLCAQVKELTGVELVPTPRSSYNLRGDVEGDKAYDLAYYHYDFPDTSYWLGPLFGPPPGTGDDSKNIFKYQNANLTTLLDGMKSYRDFAKVQEHQWLTQDLLNSELPFIPLWQLDPLLAYHRDVQPATLDPLLVFSNIEQWRLMRK
jgi:ABC-type transport system substrate-binding protein